MGTKVKDTDHRAAAIVIGWYDEKFDIVDKFYHRTYHGPEGYAKYKETYIADPAAARALLLKDMTALNLDPLLKSGSVLELLSVLYVFCDLDLDMSYTSFINYGKNLSVRRRKVAERNLKRRYCSQKYTIARWDSFAPSWMLDWLPLLNK